jgi:hypothetical protein
MEHPEHAHDPESLDRAVESFMRATEGWLASWSSAIRRLAADPESLSQLRRSRESATVGPAMAMRPLFLDHSHPLWNRELDW